MCIVVPVSTFKAEPKLHLSYHCKFGKNRSPPIVFTTNSLSFSNVIFIIAVFVYVLAGYSAEIKLSEAVILSALSLLI